MGILSPVVLLDAVRRERNYRLAESSLAEFTKQAWNIIEPTTTYCDNWHVHAICDHLEAVSAGEINNLLINVPPGTMKLCADSTPVPTLAGYRKHGDLKPGDYVFAPSGNPVRIRAITDKAPANFAVEFTNGEVIQCNGDHLWTVYDRFNARRLGTYSVNELLARGTIWVEPEGRARYSLPDNEALEFEEKDLPLHPYFVGAWLGDGSKTKPCITHSVDDTAHITKIESLGFAVTALHKSGGKTRHSYFARQNVIQRIRALGLFDNKHIPECYATGSVEQRLELLAGLIDTDGHVEPTRGRVKIGTVVPRFAFEIERLVASLGFRFFTDKRPAPGYNGKPATNGIYTIVFEPNRSIPTAIARKKIARTDALRRKIAIRSITKVENPELGHCINLDSEDGLYIVGHKHIVTHNSILVSVMWPAWEWLADQSIRVLGASYGEDLALRDAKKTRDIILSPWYQARWPQVQIEKGQDQKTHYALTGSGWRIATSVGGRATGQHPDRKIVDDPHSAKQANSDAERTSATNWFKGTLSTRGVSRGARTVVVMQRLHEQDVSGLIIEEMMSDYEHLFLPMRYESGTRKKATCIGFSDPRTVEGSLLWPALFPEKVLAKLEVALGSYGAAGQLQQRPAPAGGGILKIEDHVQLWPANKPLPDFTSVIQSWDTAFTEKTTGDPSACTVWGFTSLEGKRIMILLDASADTLTYPVLKKKVIEDWGAVYGENERHADFVLVEKKASGQSILQDLQVAGIPAKPYNPGNADKVARAHMTAPILETDVVYVIESKAEPGKPVTWARPFIAQCAGFPNAKHDDLTDTFTQCTIYARDAGLIAAPEVDVEEDDEVDYSKNRRVNPYGR